MQKQRLTIDIYTTPHGVITVESTIPDADLHEILQKAQMSLINFEDLDELGKDINNEMDSIILNALHQ